MHTSTFETAADRDFATRLDDAGGGAKTLLLEQWVIHPMAIAVNVIETFSDFVIAAGVTAKSAE